MHFHYHHEICFKMRSNIDIFAKLQKSSNFGWSRMTPLWIYPNGFSQVASIRFRFSTKFLCKTANKTYCTPKCKVGPWFNRANSQPNQAKEVKSSVSQFQEHCSTNSFQLRERQQIMLRTPEL